MITTSDIQNLIAFAVVNNRTGVIQALALAKMPVSPTITDSELVKTLWQVFSQSGLGALKSILARVPVNKASVTAGQKESITATFQDPATAGRFGDWFNNTVQFFGDLIGGHSVSTTDPTVQQQTSASPISPTMMGLVVVLGIVLIAIFRKYTAVVVGVIVIVLAVVIYGVFAKTVTTTVSGGSTTTQQHGGIGSAIIQGLIGFFK